MFRHIIKKKACLAYHDMRFISPLTGRASNHTARSLVFQSRQTPLNTTKSWFGKSPRTLFSTTTKLIIGGLVVASVPVTIEVVSQSSIKSKDSGKNYPVTTFGGKLSNTDLIKYPCGIGLILSLPCSPITKAILLLTEGLIYWSTHPTMKTLSTQISQYSQGKILKAIRKSFPDKPPMDGLCAGLTTLYLVLKSKNIDIVKELVMIRISLDQGVPLTDKQEMIFNSLLVAQSMFDNKIRLKLDHCYSNNAKWSVALDTASCILDSIRENKSSKTMIFLFMDPRKNNLLTKIAQWRHSKGEAHVIGVFCKNKQISLFDSNCYAGDFNETDIQAAKESLAYMILFYVQHCYFSLVVACKMNIELINDKNQKVGIRHLIEDKTGKSEDEITIHINLEELPRPRQKLTATEVHQAAVRSLP